MNNSKQKTIMVLIIILVIVLVVLTGITLYLYMSNNLNNNNLSSNNSENGSNLDTGSTYLNDLFVNEFGTEALPEQAANPRLSELESPLQVGEWGVASIYYPFDVNGNTTEYKNVYAKVTNVIKGDEADRIARENMSGNQMIQYVEPNEGMEWVLIEFDFDFGELYDGKEQPIFVDTNVCALDGSNIIVYNNVPYECSAVDYSYTFRYDTQTGFGRFFAQLPIGCTDYIILIGSPNDNVAYIRGI